MEYRKYQPYHKSTLVWAALGIMSGIVLGVGIHVTVKSLTQRSVNLPIVGIGGGVPTPTVASAIPSDPKREEDLRVSINNLLHDRVSLLTAAMRSAHEGSVDFDAAEAALQENTRSISNQVSRIVGPSSGDQFLSDMQKRDTAFAAYARAINSNTGADDAVRQRAVIDQYSTQFTHYLTQNRIAAQSKIVTSAFDTETRLMLNGIDAYHDRNFQQAYMRQQEAYDHAGTVADAFTHFIISQYPTSY